MPYPRDTYQFPIQPGSIDAAVAANEEKKRLDDQALREWQAAQDQAALQERLMRTQTDMKQEMLGAETDQLKRRNRMGISPLAAQLVDPYSAAYEDIDPATGAAPEPFVDVSIGDEMGSAPEPVRPMGISPFRRLKEENKKAYENLGQPTNSRIGIDEYIQRKNADVDARNTTTQFSTDAKGRLVMTKAQLDAYAKAYQGTTSDKSADIPAATQEYLDKVDKTIQSARPSAAANQTTTPAEAPIVDVSDDQVIKSTASGVYYKKPDGTTWFRHKDGREKQMGN